MDIIEEVLGIYASDKEKECVRRYIDIAIRRDYEALIALDRNKTCIAPLVLIAMGDLDTLKWLREVNLVNMYTPICTNAVTCNKLDILKWAIETGYRYSKLELVRLASFKGHLNILKYLVDERECLIDRICGEYVLESDNIECLDYILTKVNPEKKASILWYRATYLKKKKILTYLHNRGMSKKEDCLSGQCIICKKEMLKDLWEMESLTYDSAIQWLPLEVLDDIIEIM